MSQDLSPTLLDDNKEYSLDQIAIIKNTVAPGLTDDEMKVFLYNCVRTGLDPFAKQIYAIKRGGRMTIQTGIDGFRLIAERSNKYSPGRDTEFLYSDGGLLLGAKVFIKKMTLDGTWHEISALALIKEYSTGKNLWYSKPHTMIEKVAESRALRRGFPSDLSGIYSKEEMEQSEAILNCHTTVETSKSFISEEAYQKLDVFVNGYDDLRKKLTELCNVDDLRKIDETQLEGCRAYARNYTKRKNDDSPKD